MPRAVWSGAISFGLVNVPVKVYSAVSQKDIRFHQLHKADGGRVRYRKVCALDGAELKADEIVKGYEVSPEKWVTFEEDEMDAADPAASRSIDIEQFVALEEIDPVHFEHPYYLVPDKGASKPYALLLAAMEDTKRVALGRVVMRGKQYLVAVRGKDGALVMSTMLYPDEVVPAERIEGIPVKGARPTDKEVAMARQLVEALTEEFDPEKYRDEYRERVLELIEKKAAGETIEVPEVERPKAPTDLLAALQASLDAARKRDKAHAEAEA